MPTLSIEKMTAEQFLMLDEDPPGIRRELVDGAIIVSPSPRPKHSRPEKRLSSFLMTHILEYELGDLIGDVDTIFGPYDVRRPDIIYYRADRMHLIDDTKALSAPPDLCVEVISPSSGKIDRKDKFAQYAKAGVEFYWIVDPMARTIEAFQLSGKKYLPIGRGESNDVVRLLPFPELEIPMGKLWDRVPKK